MVHWYIVIVCKVLTYCRRIYNDVGTNLTYIKKKKLKAILCYGPLEKKYNHHISHLYISESEVAQLCPTLCDPMDCSLAGSSIHGIFQARILEWVAVSFCRGCSWPRDRTWVSHTAGGLYYLRHQESPMYKWMEG